MGSNPIGKKCVKIPDDISELVRNNFKEFRILAVNIFSFIFSIFFNIIILFFLILLEKNIITLTKKIKNK